VSLHVVGVQRGLARKVMISGRSFLTAITKTAVSDVVSLGPLGLQGDEQVDLSVHGGLDKAVYAYPSEHYPFWQGQRANAGVAPLDTALAYGALGENLTLAGLLEQDVWVGDVLRFANCSLRVTQPREPCFKFNAVMGFSQATKVMAQTGFCGFYLAVDVPGTLQAGESFELVTERRSMGIPELFKAKLFKHMR
jgi:MOSC domain-containing protein YiiM